MQVEAYNVTTKRKRYLNAIPILIASMTFVAVTWLGIMAEGSTLIEELSQASSSIRLLAEDVETLLAAGFLLSMIGVGVSSVLLVRKAFIFLGIWIFLLSVAEARIPVLQQLSLALRYPMMISLMLVGIYGLWTNLGQLRLPQILGLFILFWSLVQLGIHTITTEALLLLPMQLAIFVGIFFGLPLLVTTLGDGRKLCYALAVVGAISILVNYLAFIFVPQVYIRGRFTSWFALPTGFANNFVLCITPIIWATLDTKRNALRLLFSGLFVAAAFLLILSGTRNSILAIALSSLILTALWKRRFFVYVLVGGTLLLLGALVFNLGLSDLGNAGLRIGEVSNTEERFSVWTRALTYIWRNPVWGYGLSVGLQDLDKYLPSWELLNSHNAFLSIWLRMGIFGVLAYLVLYLHALFSAAFLLLKRRSSEHDMSVIVLFFCLLSELFVAGLFEENLTSRASIQQALWAVSITMIFIETRRMKQQRKQRIRQDRTDFDAHPIAP